MKNFLLALILICLGSCNTETKLDPIDISQIVIESGVSPDTSTLLIVRLSDNQKWVSNIDRVNIEYSPASTSKIPHTLIALETGVAKAESRFIWDGQERFFEGWNQDQTLLSAYQRSAVWVYQDIVEKLGSQEMSDWLEALQYGNGDVGTSDELTTYWLGEPLQISAQEQVSFLTKLVQQTLPFSEETYKIAMSIFENEKTDSQILYAKTGWMHDEDKTDIGWFVGWLKNNEKEEEYIFAFNLDMKSSSLRSKRKALVVTALKAIGAWSE